jgi:hypothetical protein
LVAFSTLTRSLIDLQRLLRKSEVVLSPFPLSLLSSLTPSLSRRMELNERPLSQDSSRHLLGYNSDHLSSSPEDLSPSSHPPSEHPFFASQAIGDILHAPSPPRTPPPVGSRVVRPSRFDAGWSRDWLGLAAAGAGLLVLVAWIVAAAIISGIELFVPLDYFGDGAITASSYKFVVFFLLPSFALCFY